MSDLTNLQKVATKAKDYVDNKVSAINSSISSEASLRIAADNTLQININAEKKRAEEAEVELKNRIDDIDAKVPTQASATNQLADKDFVNSSIATATATFRGLKTTLAEIKAQSGDLNDYCILKITDKKGNIIQYDRYKYTDTYSETTGYWALEYTLNNSSFTDAQWEAINSGITEDLVDLISSDSSLISDHIGNKNNPHGVTKAQVSLGNVVNTGDSATPTQNGTTKFTTGGAYTLKQSIDTNTTNITNEISNRQKGDSATLESAKTYSDGNLSVAKTYAEGLFATDAQVTAMLTEVFGS